MMADMNEWAAMNAVYVSYFAPRRAAGAQRRSADAPALGGRLELEAIAVVRR
jgi:enamine deaminase RidA (YjgF/YER057c/UK114 family)